MGNFKKWETSKEKEGNQWGRDLKEKKDDKIERRQNKWRKWNRF